MRPAAILHLGGCVGSTALGSGLFLVWSEPSTFLFCARFSPADTTLPPTSSVSASSDLGLW